MNDATAEVMIVSSDLESRRHLKRILTANGIDPICASTLADGREALFSHNVGLIFCDATVADGSYRDLLREPPVTAGSARVVVTSRVGGWEDFLDAMRLGAFDMIVMPCQPTDVEWVVSQAAREKIRMSARPPLRTPSGHEVQLRRPA